VLLISLGTENKPQLVEDSICHAKEAVMLDVKDGNSWCKFFLIPLLEENCVTWN